MPGLVELQTTFPSIAESVRPLARAVTAGLKAKSYDVPGTENVGSSKSPDVTEVRYFRVEDVTTADAIVERLKDLHVPNSVSTQPANLTARPNQFEIWFGKNQMAIPGSLSPTPGKSNTHSP